MSVKNNKVCCNCRHCKRIQDQKYNNIKCNCEIVNRYLGYVEVMNSCCKHWSKEKEQTERSED